MKQNKFFAILLSLVLLCSTAFAGDISPNAKESVQGTISATDAAAVTIIAKAHVVLVNNGANTVRIRFNSTNAATTSDFALVKDASVTVDATPGNQIHQIGTICAAAETASVVYIAWN